MKTIIKKEENEIKEEILKSAEWDLNYSLKKLTESQKVFTVLEKEGFTESNCDRLKDIKSDIKYYSKKVNTALIMKKAINNL